MLRRARGLYKRFSIMRNAGVIEHENIFKTLALAKIRHFKHSKSEGKRKKGMKKVGNHSYLI